MQVKNIYIYAHICMCTYMYIYIYTYVVFGPIAEVGAQSKQVDLELQLFPEDYVDREEAPQ